jgi:phosphoribosylformylglycinamidine synthase
MLSSDDLLHLKNELKRDPTPVELAVFDNLWCEHCSYRSTKMLLRTLPTEGDNVLLGPGDDAAVVRFSEDVALVIGMESHNHPSYVDPYHGSATGVGGIVRDVVSMGGKPIALLDPLYFGPPADDKNRYLFEHVVAGIGDYGNCIGVPVVRGEVVFDPSYRGNPLVNVVCVGIVHPQKFITARAKAPGNRLVLFGSSTGRDGLGGASFASRDLSESSEALDRPSVQIGDPFTEKLIIDATLEMAATGKILSCKDLGAAGLAGASSEMCSTFGALITADQVHLREKGMNAVEIMLAESQERILIEVAQQDVPLMGAIAEKYDLRWSDIGEVVNQPRYIVQFRGEVVCDLPIALITAGAPLCFWNKEPRRAIRPFTPPGADLETLALRVLSHPDVARKDWVFEQYDRMVQLRSVALERDAAVLRVAGKALVLSCGCNPRHIFLNPHDGTANAVIENAANLACRGAAPLCIVDCLNFASPVHPDVYWELEQSVLGLGMMARSLGIPIVGGNVSLYNESDEFGTRIKPTPSLGMAGIGDLREETSPEEGNALVIVGESGPHFGGSVLDDCTGCGGDPPPVPDPSVISQVRDLVKSGAVRAATDLSMGGLLAAIVKLAPAASVHLQGSLLQALFSESYGRFLLAVDREADFCGLRHSVIGEIGGKSLRIRSESGAVTLPAKKIDDALNSLTKKMRF